MQYGLVVVPPAELAARIREFQKNQLRVLPLAAPHITVKAQGGLGQDEAWLDDVRAVAARFPAFRTGVAGIGMFGEEFLYLRAEPGEALVRLHAALLKAVNPAPALIERYFEGKAYVPHLTLAGPGLSSHEMAVVKVAAEERFAIRELFDVTFVRVLRQAKDGEPFLGYLDLPLA
jgi:2'-5' RNA ligase